MTGIRTDPKVESALKAELGERALSWLYDVNLQEWEVDAYAAIPLISWDMAESLFEAELHE